MNKKWWCDNCKAFRKTSMVPINGYKASNDIKCTECHWIIATLRDGSASDNVEGANLQPLTHAAENGEAPLPAGA